ncbi:phasin [Bradyrhizobium manausense]|uniref:phasin n=1 Tax=Bradyrhizobium TaxID=374 RepID=UPI001BA819F6|nr:MULTISPECIES: phasin [Bradyrhizobium]MBR0826957.1 phasin [Bradyrhizobium manausense]UVO32237.1 phasin [Bradyrhizobium arachidis]
MNDANVKVQTNAEPLNAANGSEKIRFELPLFVADGLFRGFAEQGATRAKENLEKMKAASEEITEVLREAYSTNASGAADYGVKVMQISSVNASSAWEFLVQLAGAKSLVDVVNLSTMQSRKTFEAATHQNRELWELARKVATETAEPVKKSFDRVLHKAS